MAYDISDLRIRNVFLNSLDVIYCGKSALTRLIIDGIQFWYPFNFVLKRASVHRHEISNDRSIFSKNFSKKRA